jgi:hypothetical protein
MLHAAIPVGVQNGAQGQRSDIFGLQRVDKPRKFNVEKSVSVEHQKDVVDSACDAVQRAGRAGWRRFNDDLDIGAPDSPPLISLDKLLRHMACRQQDVANAAVGELGQQEVQERPIRRDRHQGLGRVFGEGAKTRAPAANQHDGLLHALSHTRPHFR